MEERVGEVDKFVAAVIGARDKGDISPEILIEFLTETMCGAIAQNAADSSSCGERRKNSSFFSTRPSLDS